MANPRRIPSNFRLQTYIEAELVETKKLEDAKEHTTTDHVNIGLTYLEIGNWPKVESAATKILTSEGEKSSDAQDKEAIATAHYLLGTMKREKNDCSGALDEFKLAQSLAPSVWLQSNLFRNIGLAYLKAQRFTEAYAVFTQAFKFTKPHAELQGSLPALSNYCALTHTKAALQANEDPAPGLKEFEDTTSLYEATFRELKVSEQDQLKSHDWQSHQVHRGMTLCELAEKNKKIDQAAEFKKAESLLLGALAGRIENKADDQRLGDVCVWLGRAAVGLKDFVKAEEYFGKALKHFEIAFSGNSDATQIKDVKARLLHCKEFAGLKAPGSLGVIASSIVSVEAVSAVPTSALPFGTRI